MSDTPNVKIPQAGARRSFDWLALAGYLAVALTLLWPLPTRMAARMIGDPFGDPLLNAFILAWDADRLAHGFRGLWQAPFFYPATDTLAWSEHLLGIALFTAPVQWLTGSFIAAYNTALVGSIVLAGVGMYLLTRSLTGRSDAAWIAGTLFACLPYRVAQLPHLQVLMAGWMPLALLGLHRYLDTGRWWPLGGFVAAYLLQALSNGYYLFFLAVPVALLIGVEAARHRRDRRWLVSRVGGLALASVAIGAGLAPVAGAYLRVRDHYGFSRGRTEAAAFSATPSSFASVSSATRLWRDVLPVGKGERELFPGLALTTLAIVGLVVGLRHPHGPFYAAVAVVACLLAFGPTPDFGWGRLSTGPYDWLRSTMPGLDGLRVPARFAMVQYLGMSVLAAIAVSAWLEGRAKWARWIAAALISALAIAEGSSTLRVRLFPRPEMAVEDLAYGWLAKSPPGPMLELPVAPIARATRYMAGTLSHGNPIVNGYSGYGWALEDLFGGPVATEPFLAPELARAARTVGVRYLLVHRHLYGDPALAARQVASMAAEAGDVERVEEIGTTSVVLLRARNDRVPAPPDPPLTLAGCAIDASHNADTLSRAFDGNIASRWLTGPPQSGDEWLRVGCGTPHVLTGLRLLLDRRSYGDFARRLAVDAAVDGASFATVWEGGVVAELATSLARADRPTAIVIPLPPTLFRAVRLRQVAQTPRRSTWAVPELQLLGRER